MVKLSKITLHWTAGINYPNSVDKQHYHFLIDKDGRVIKGTHKPEDNMDCTDGNYAAHCGGGNTGNISVALCGMYGYKNPQSVGEYPLTKIQCERAFKLVAELCKKYNIPITPDHVFTHYEFGKSHPKTSSAGKIDITYLPPYPHILKDEVGSFIRSKVRYYYEPPKFVSL